MAKEISCGILVIRREGEKRQLLMIQSKKGGHWSYPKGHMEAGETQLDTARREVWEETGLKVEPIPGETHSTEYPLPNGNTKEVVYFMGHYEGGEARQQEAELTTLGWFDLEEAEKKVTYESDRMILRAFMKSLKKL